MKTKTLLAFLLFFISKISFAQITFQKTYGGAGEDYSNSVQQTIDGGYIIIGVTKSYGAGDADVYLLKTDTVGTPIWTKTFGGISTDRGVSIQQTYEGGYIIVGTTWSYGTGGADVNLIRTDVNGNLLWTKTYGGADTEEAFCVRQTTDGGYIITGATYSFSFGYNDVYLIKTDSLGDTLWTKTFGGTGAEYASSLQQTTDGGYIITGYTRIIGGYFDVYLIKTNSSGDTLWTKAIGGTNHDIGFSIQQTTDGGYIITGQTMSFGVNGDVYLIKTDANGSLLWTKAFGGTNGEFGRSVVQTKDGGYVIAGSTSFGAGLFDFYLIKTNSIGDTLWTKAFGGILNDQGYSVQQTSDGGFIIIGSTTSFGSGDEDLYLIKTDSLGNSGCNEGVTATITTTPATLLTSPATIISSGGIVTTPSIFVGSGATVTTLCATVGINPTPAPSALGGEGVAIAPNPFHSSATLTIDNNLFNNNLTLSIFNVEGKILHKQQVTSHQTIIERNGLADGLYFYKLAENGIVKSVGKLLVE